MSGNQNLKTLALPADVVFCYDGSLAGLYCCVYACVYTRMLPFAIRPEDEPQVTLMDERRIETDLEKARRVRKSIQERIAPRAVELVENVFLSCLENRELAILRFLLLGYREGPRTVHMLGHPDVDLLVKAENHLLHERHLLLGFVRFSDFNGRLMSVISPKNFVLPLLAGHFIARFSQEEFLIYDKTNGAALVYRNRSAEIIPAEHLVLPQADETEETFRALWRQFYHTISIEGRHNPKCRMTHCAKRYWENMTELADQL